MPDQIPSGTRVCVFIGRDEEAIVLSRLVRGHSLDVYLLKLVNHKEVYVATPIAAINRRNEKQANEGGGRCGGKPSRSSGLAAIA